MVSVRMLHGCSPFLLRSILNLRMVSAGVLGDGEAVAV